MKYPVGTVLDIGIPGSMYVGYKTAVVIDPPKTYSNGYYTRHSDTLTCFLVDGYNYHGYSPDEGWFHFERNESIARYPVIYIPTTVDVGDMEDDL